MTQTDLHSKVLKPTPLANQQPGFRLEIQCTPEEKTGEEGRATNDPASGLDIPPVKRRFPSSLCVTACRYMLYTLSLPPAIFFMYRKKKRGKDVLKLLDYTSRAARRSRRGSKRSSRKNKKWRKREMEERAQGKKRMEKKVHPILFG